MSNRRRRPIAGPVRRIIALLVSVALLGTAVAPGYVYDAPSRVVGATHNGAAAAHTTTTPHLNWRTATPAATVGDAGAAGVSLRPLALERAAKGVRKVRFQTRLRTTFLSSGA